MRLTQQEQNALTNGILDAKVRGVQNFVDTLIDAININGPDYFTTKDLIELLRAAAKEYELSLLRQKK